MENILPYPNEHAARMIDPGKFEEKSFRRKKLPGTQVMAIYGKLKGESTMTLQAYRFPTAHYTAEEARAWLKKQEVKPILFEPAKKEDAVDDLVDSDTIPELEDNTTLKTDQHSTQSVQHSGPSVRRYDTIDSMNWMTSTFTRTSEGFLKGRAIVTSVGVFQYKKEDGSFQFELRLPEEVFDYESLESLKLKPIANDHPKEVVTPENVKEYQVGSLGDNPGSQLGSYGPDGRWVPMTNQTDGYHLAIDAIITEAGAIQDVLNGKRSLSCGYTCDLEEKEGVWCGIPYNFIQRRIRYNHVAIVDEARAGDAAMIRLDSLSAVLVNIKKEDASMSEMKKITLDSVEYQAEGPVISALSRAQKRMDAVRQFLNRFFKEDDIHEDDIDKHLNRLKEEHSKVEADRDKFKDKCDKLQQENDSLKSKLAGSDDEGDDDKKKDGIDPAEKAARDERRKKRQDAIDNAVKVKLSLLRAAEKAGIEKTDGVEDADLRKQVILKVYPKANLDGKDEVYIKARFDSAVEVLDEEDKNNIHTRSVGGAQIPEMDAHADGTKDPKATRTAEHAREDMIARMKKDSRGESDKK